MYKKWLAKLLDTSKFTNKTTCFLIQGTLFSCSLNFATLQRLFLKHIWKRTKLSTNKTYYYSSFGMEAGTNAIFQGPLSISSLDLSSDFSCSATTISISRRLSKSNALSSLSSSSAASASSHFSRKSSRRLA